jgi:hypothetical protein
MNLDPKALFYCLTHGLTPTTRNSVRSAVFVLCLSLTYTLTSCSKPEGQRDRIVSSIKYPLAYSLNPHVGGVNVLTVDGKRFEHVRGISRFYIAIPQIHSILFVVDNPNYSCTYHIYNLDTRTDTAMVVRSSVFGHTIGSDRPRDTVDQIKGPELLLKNASESVNDSTTSLVYLDIKKGIVTKEETRFFDNNHNLVRVYNKPPPF